MTPIGSTSHACSPPRRPRGSRSRSTARSIGWTSTTTTRGSRRIPGAGRGFDPVGTPPGGPPAPPATRGPASTHQAPLLQAEPRDHRSRFRHGRRSSEGDATGRAPPRHGVHGGAGGGGGGGKRGGG